MKANSPQWSPRGVNNPHCNRAARFSALQWNLSSSTKKLREDWFNYIESTILINAHVIKSMETVDEHHLTNRIRPQESSRMDMMLPVIRSTQYYNALTVILDGTEIIRSVLICAPFSCIRSPMTTTYQWKFEELGYLDTIKDLLLNTHICIINKNFKQIASSITSRHPYKVGKETWIKKVWH